MKNLILIFVVLSPFILACTNYQQELATIEKYEKALNPASIEWVDFKYLGEVSAQDSIEIFLEQYSEGRKESFQDAYELLEHMDYVINRIKFYNDAHTARLEGAKSENMFALYTIYVDGQLRGLNHIIDRLEKRNKLSRYVQKPGRILARKFQCTFEAEDPNHAKRTSISKIYLTNEEDGQILNSIEVN